MELRTYYNGIRRGMLKPVFQRRGPENPFTAYGRLGRDLSTENCSPEQVRANLRKRVKEGLVSLEELLADGRATLLFRRVSLLDEAVATLAQRRAVVLSRPGSRLEKFLLKGSLAVPYVVERLLPEDVAQALVNCSERVQTRSVKELKIVERSTQVGRDHYFRIRFKLQYDEAGPVTTRFFPGSVQKALSFYRQATRVLGINRGVVLTDRWVANLGEILDALGRMKTTPLDQILICLRDNQGRVYPELPSTWHWPEGERGEIINRDHFTEAARGAIHRVVNEEYHRMLSNQGNPLSFRAYLTRRDNGELDLAISWEN